jgi:hypothetical protein
MIGALAKLGLGFLIGFTGAVIPGPFTVFIVTDGLSSGNRFHGVLAALGHCVVEAEIILLIVLGFATLGDRTPLCLLNMAGGLALVVYGILAFRGRDRDVLKEGSKLPMKERFLRRYYAFCPQWDNSIVVGDRWSSITHVCSNELSLGRRVAVCLRPLGGRHLLVWFPQLLILCWSRAIRWLIWENRYSLFSTPSSGGNMFRLYINPRLMCSRESLNSVAKLPRVSEQ